MCIILNATSFTCDWHFIETEIVLASKREPLPLLWARVFVYSMEISQPLSLSYSDVQISIDN